MSSADKPPPGGWTRGVSRTQKRAYYFHREERHSQWHFPTAAEAGDPMKAKKLADFKRRLKASQKQKLENAASVAVPKKIATKECPSVAIIVPYRDLHVAQNRAKHLSRFVPHMKSFLADLLSKNIICDYHIYIVEQSDDGRKFNRGKLLNVGFDYAVKRSERHTPRHNVFNFHDVDLLPASDIGTWYARFPTKPLHIARVWDRYSNNPKYFGGIVSFSEEDMRRINGYPNTFWGWGGEDDEMQLRLQKNAIEWTAPDRGTIHDLEEMDLSTKLQFLRENKSWKNMCKWEAAKEHESTWKTNGLADLTFEIQRVTSLDPEGAKQGGGSKVTKLTVDVKLNPGHWLNDKSGVDYLGG